MFCPKCSQQQPRDEMRFCSRCGFPLADVALLLHNDGVMPLVAGDSTGKPFSARSRMLFESGILTLGSWGVAIGATFLWDHGSALETVAKLASIVFSLLGLIGLLRFLYAFLFFKESPSRPTDSLTSGTDRPVLAAASVAALPAQRHAVISDYPRRTNTKEMARKPPSVTENTTRLLEE